MTTACGSCSTSSIALRASPFLFAVPLVTGLAGALCMWSVADEFPSNVIFNGWLTFVFVGLYGGVGAYAMALLDGLSSHRFRVWSATLAGVAASAIRVFYAHSSLDTQTQWILVGLSLLGIVASSLVVRRLSR